jgi:hypothetical protein
VLSPVEVEVHQFGEVFARAPRCRTSMTSASSRVSSFSAFRRLPLDLSADASLLASDRIHAGVDADLPPVATLVDGHSAHLRPT